jgi:hypothetical protein
MERWVEGMGCVSLFSMIQMAPSGGTPTPTPGSGGAAPTPAPAAPEMPTYAPTPTLGRRFPVLNLGGAGLYDDGLVSSHRRGNAVYPFDPAGFGGPQIPILRG